MPRKCVRCVAGKQVGSQLRVDAPDNFLAFLDSPANVSEPPTFKCVSGHAKWRETELNRFKSQLIAGFGFVTRSDIPESHPAVTQLSPTAFKVTSYASSFFLFFSNTQPFLFNGSAETGRLLIRGKIGLFHSDLQHFRYAKLTDTLSVNL